MLMVLWKVHDMYHLYNDYWFESCLLCFRAGFLGQEFLVVLILVLVIDWDFQNYFCVNVIFISSELSFWIMNVVELIDLSSFFIFKLVMLGCFKIATIFQVLPRIISKSLCSKIVKGPTAVAFIYNVTKLLHMLSV